LKSFNHLTAVPKKKKKRKNEDISQLSPESEAPTATKKTAKRQTPRRATAAKRPPKPRDTEEQTAHISATPETDMTPVSGEPLEDAVRLRAYFISERRRRFALPGDTESDWLEAKRQLLAEARR
jgi:DsbC/DsbD-like thiol-disulfide interchange protein